MREDFYASGEALGGVSDVRREPPSITLFEFGTAGASYLALSGRAAQDISAGLAALEEGRAALKARNTEVAAAAFGKACALAPSEADSCYYSGQTLHMLGRFDESQRALERALEHATARAHGATLWTQDADFDGMPGIKYREKKP